MGDVIKSAVDSITDVLEDVVEDLIDVVGAVWDDVIIELAEDIVAIIGIEDQIIIQTDHVSTKLYTDDDADFVKRALVATALDRQKHNSSGVLSHFIKHTYEAKSKGDKYYQYGENEYIRGLPTASIHSNAIDPADVDAAITSQLGVPITVTKVDKRYPSDETLAKFILQLSHDYINSTNSLTLTIFPGNTFHDFLITDIAYDSGANFFTVTVNRGGADELIGFSAGVRKSQVIAEAYITSEGASAWFYWFYDVSTGTFPDIKEVVSSSTNLEMMPVAVLREDGVNIVDGDSEYATTRLLIERLGINIEDLTGYLDANPDESNLETAFLSFGINPIDTGGTISKTLYLLFNDLLNTVDDDPNKQDSHYVTFKEGNVNRAIVWEDQEFQSVLANIDDEYHHFISGNNLILQWNSSLLPGSVAVTQLTIFNLSSIDFIEKDSLVESSATVIGNDDFHVPLSHFVIDKLTALEQLEVYPNILRFDFYAASITHIDWYETTRFTSLFQAVLILVSIFTLNPSALSWQQVATKLAFNYLVAEIAFALIRAVDDDFLKILIAAAAIYTSSRISGSSSEFLSADEVVNGVTQFSDFLTDYYEQDLIGIQEDRAELQELFDIRTEENEAAAFQSESLISTSEVVSLISVDTSLYLSREQQYDFSSMYNYDTLISDFHDNALRLGVV
jgi:hypothetical protein